MRVVLTTLVALGLCGCGIIYKLPTRQGNVIDQKKVEQLEVGMTPEQVRFLMGTPIASSTLSPERWDYVGYYRNPRGKEFKRTVSVYFEAEKVTRLTGTDDPFAGSSEGVDADSLEAEAGKDAKEERDEDVPESGIVITPQ